MTLHRLTTKRVGWQAGKWGVKSVAGLLANLAMLTLWVDYVGLHPAVAIVPNYVILSVAGYAVTDQWVFADGVSPAGWLAHARQYVGQQAGMLASKAVNYVLYVGLLPLVDYRAAWVIGAVVSFALTFALMRWWWSP